MKLILLLLFVLCTLIFKSESNVRLKANEDWRAMERAKSMVSMWAKKIGAKLQQLSKKMTREDEVEKSFVILEDKLVQEDAADLIHDVAYDIETMMKQKEEAVHNIADYMEFIHYHRNDTPLFENGTYEYFNADNLTSTDYTPEALDDLHSIILNNECHWKCEQPSKSDLTNNKFANPKRRLKLFAPRDNEEGRECNCKHLPEKERPRRTYESLPLKDDSRFGTKVNLDISIAKLALNVYEREQDVLEGLRWSEALDLVFKENYKNDHTLTWQYFASPKGFMRHYPAVQWEDENYKKTYDFRTRTWYTEAFTSPKDIIILVDRSGSIIGTRRALSDQIVNQILDTLNDNDFVNIYTFANFTEPLVKCFNDTLFQANEENLRLLRQAIPVYEEMFAADLTIGISKAFDILENFRRTQTSANCNQAIMVIHEGLDYDYDKEIYANRNWKKNFPVRIFTYQLGQDTTDARELEWIACSNMGYWGNITDMGDIREKMLQYLNVMSRPINLKADKNRTFIWSYLHVDLADRRLSNWLWKKFEGIRQRDVFLDYIKRGIFRQNLMLTSEKHMLLKEEYTYQTYLSYQRDNSAYDYMTTVSLPVFARRPHEYQLLGVAGIDVPLSLFKQLIPYERLGVNGYAFIVTNNGYILTHPDHHTEFQYILKPTFNRVDILEVEILNDDKEPRMFGDSVVKFRKKLVNQESSVNVTLKVKYALNDNKRLMFAHRHYYFAAIGPFTLCVVLPHKYGFDIVNKTLLERPSVKSSASSLASSYWKVHPDWIYCKKCVGDTPEDKVRSAFSLNENSSLLTSLLYDMEATKWFDEYGGSDPVEEQFVIDYQVHKVFLATYSGLTRWRNFEDINNIREEDEDSFEKRNNRAIDEDWYRRAVELNFGDESMFIYSVPWETSGYENNTMITSTKAIFVENGDLKSPVAVVGLQFNHREMYEWYNDITTQCKETRCKITCKHKDLNCYILDNNAYIVLSDEPEYIGRYIGDIRPDILSDLIDDKIFIPTRMFDYQAICQKIPPKKEPEAVRIRKRKEKMAAKKPKARAVKSSAAPTVVKIMNHFWALKDWLVTTFYLLFNVVTGQEDEIYNSTKEEYINFAKLIIEKTVPTPCDQERWLFNLNTSAKFPFSQFVEGTKFQCSWPYVIDKIPNTNLLFLATNDGEEACKGRFTNIYSNEPKEVIYNTSLPCYIATMNNYTRRMYMDCHNRNKKEDHLNQESRYYCGHTWC
ncbi:voltage-dependent calcium channel subunit alpha-2/delta-3-like [Diabrotica virgifera virgifera]|uniref:VWFA domain-containing protein n=1 Tax=Diabrotica virgifera virgifera TaxID=50390 RepID=A0ABM5IC58_DIAVI|nr:voltage-dependent calcium channel subunit alpha-2/delta-3-like [Diabrotica virgifera virgifera]